MLQRAASLAAATMIALAVAVGLAGTAYIHGAEFTTFNRTAGVAGEEFGWPAAKPMQVAQLSWTALGLIACLGFAALAVALLLERRRSLLRAAGAARRRRNAGDDREHEDKQLDLARQARRLRRVVLLHRRRLRAWPRSRTGAHLVLEGSRHRRVAGRRRIRRSYLRGSSQHNRRRHKRHSRRARQPGTASMAAQDANVQRLPQPYLQLSPGSRYLLAGTLNAQLLYNEHLNVHWWQYANDSYFKYPVPGHGGNAAGTSKGAYLYGAPAYSAATRAHWFSMISLVGNYRNANDAAILAAIKSTPGYVLLTTQGGAPTYLWVPDYPAWARVSLSAGTARRAAGEQPPAATPPARPPAQVPRAPHTSRTPHTLHSFA